MMLLNANMQKMYYALYVGEAPVYVLDEHGNKIVEYVDSEGNVYYKETGEYEPSYSTPVPFYGNISMSGGEAQVQEYGTDISAYDAVLVLGRDTIPVTETSIVWHTSIPAYKDEAGTTVDRHTADYRVEAVKPSINQLKVLLGKLVK